MSSTSGSRVFSMTCHDLQSFRISFQSFWLNLSRSYRTLPCMFGDKQDDEQRQPLVHSSLTLSPLVHNRTSTITDKKDFGNCNVNAEEELSNQADLLVNIVESGSASWCPRDQLCQCELRPSRTVQLDGEETLRCHRCTGIVRGVYAGENKEEDLSVSS